MEHVFVEFLAALRIFTKERRMDIEVPEGATITTVLNELHQKFGDGKAERIFDTSNGVSPALIILVNGTNIKNLDGIDTLVQDGDVIACVPIMAGG
ncbi:MAG TPA: MoaD family protein [Candidatus Lokiarchaeia archaeon]|nr:MoaD family protein [Candidatus Lokiarchaeia archaeon]